MALIETHHATQGKSADYPDPAEYRGCLEARETRRACHDDLCQVRATCLLWADRDQPGHMTRCMTWRRHYECHTLPCDYWQSAREPAHPPETP